MKSGQKLLCIKQYSGDIETYGIDCYEGKYYFVEDVFGNEIYIETESGSSVLFESEAEVLQYFNVA